MGAALLAAVGAGVHADVDAAVAAAVRTAGEPEAPKPDWAERYRVLHGRFAALYPALAQAGAW
jgi:xylulokinase